jgi:YHS domain-containing protein
MKKIKSSKQGIRSFRGKRIDKKMLKYMAASLGAGAILFALVVAITRSQVNAQGASGARVSDRKLVCMLQDSLQTREGLEHTYNGKRYYLCCGGCLAGFEQNPARYSHAVDPVNGKQVDKADAPIYGYKGRAYFFSSQNTLQTFARDPDKYLSQTAAAAQGANR